jgi:hypothetical protein
VKTLRLSSVILILIVSLLTISCDKSFNFRRDKKLIEEYQYTERSDVLLIYYNVTNTANNREVSMAVKNVSGNFLADLNFSIYTLKPVKLSRYIDLGNIKNRSVKNITIEVPLNTKKVYIDYEYTPMNEDMFLQFDNNRSYSDYRRFKDTIILFLP